jgi:hypothetical protein
VTAFAYLEAFFLVDPLQASSPDGDPLPAQQPVETAIAPTTAHSGVPT